MNTAMSMNRMTGLSIRKARTEIGNSVNCGMSLSGVRRENTTEKF